MNYFYEINQKGFRKPSSFYLNSDKMKAEEIDLLALRLKEIILNSKCENKDIIFLCIGSDRYTGDALGPLIGSHLEENTDSIVYGTLEQPVHAGNLKAVIAEIGRHFSRPLIIAIDACLGQQSEIGHIEIWEGTIEAGIAVGNKLPKTGDIAMIGIVNAASSLGYRELQSTSLALVMKLVKVLSLMLQNFYREAQQEQEGLLGQLFGK